MMSYKFEHLKLKCKEKEESNNPQTLFFPKTDKTKLKIDCWDLGSIPKKFVSQK